MLDYVEKNKLRNAYHLTKMAKRYNGSQTSRTKFCEVGIEGYKQQLMKRAIVKNSDGDFISFSQVRIPFRDSQADVKLYGQALFVAKKIIKHGLMQRISYCSKTKNILIKCWQTKFSQRLVCILSEKKLMK